MDISPRDMTPGYYLHALSRLHQASFTVMSPNDIKSRIFKSLPPLAALWMLEYIATFPDELQAIWFRKISEPSVIFIINRYSFLFDVVTEI